MIDTKLVKRRKRRNFAIIFTSISTFCVACFVIIAVLSSYVGNYSVGIKGYESLLALSKDPTFETESSYLRFDGMKNMIDCPWYYRELENHDYIDNEKTQTPEKGKNKIGDKDAYLYYSHTFYLSNVGTKACSYYFTMSLSDNNPDPLTGLRIDDILRIRIYENEVVDGEIQNHDFIDYTKYNKYVGNQENKNEYIKQCDEWEKQGKLKYFMEDDPDYIINYKVEELKPEQKMRYTVVFWIEANDPECEGRRNEVSKAGLTLSTNILGAEDEGQKS